LNSSSDGPSPRRARSDRFVDREVIVSVDHRAVHAVAGRAIGEIGARILLARRRRQPVVVVLDDDDDRQVPDGGEVRRFVKVAFARGAVADERCDDLARAFELRREREAVSHRHHRAEVADHADDVVAQHAEVERPIASRGIAAVLAEELPEERQQIETASCEYPEIPVHRQDVIVRVERGHHARRDRFLPDPRKPLRHLALPEKNEHLLLDEPRHQDRAVHLVQIAGRQLVDRGREIVLGNRRIGARRGHAFMITGTR
jgi:hypothetical protein